FDFKSPVAQGKTVPARHGVGPVRAGAQFLRSQGARRSAAAGLSRQCRPAAGPRRPGRIRLHPPGADRLAACCGKKRTPLWRDLYGDLSAGRSRFDRRLSLHDPLELCRAAGSAFSRGAGGN
nr:hypothetical protein [Tanacetum cinerariifolium]